MTQRLTVRPDPGGEALTRRTAELAGLHPGMHVLDVSTGRSTQAIFYATHYGVMVTGIDMKGVRTTFANRAWFVWAVRDGHLGYGLFAGIARH